MQAGNVNDEGGAFTEPEDVAAGENAADLADAIDAKLWYDEDCDNVHDDAGPIDIMLTLDFSGSMLYDQYGGVVSTDPIQVDGQSYGETTKIDLVELGTRAVHRLPAGAECRRAGRRRLLRRRGERREHPSDRHPPRTANDQPLGGRHRAVEPPSEARERCERRGPSTPFDNDGNPDPYSNADGIATGTYISEGLDDAQTELASNGRASAEKRNIVLSDGESFNGDGNTNYAPPASAAANARAASPAPATDVYTINVNGSASTLQAMAGPAGGSGGDPVFFNDINDPLNIPTVFGNLAAQTVAEKVIMEDTLANVLDALADGNGVPLDGNRATLYDELSDDPNDPDREAFRGDGVMHCVALSWELPFDVGNEIKATRSDSTSGSTPNRRATTTVPVPICRPDFPAYAGPLSSRSTLDRVADRVTTRGYDIRTSGYDRRSGGVGRAYIRVQ